MKKSLSIILALVMTLGLMVPLSASAAQNDIRVVVNGETLSFDVPPQIINSRTMVPMRAIFEKLGLKVSWDDQTKTVTARNSDIIIDMTVGSSYFTKNGSQIYLDSPAVIVDSRTLVPVRAISEAVAMKVEWDGANRIVDISDIPYTGHYIETQALTISGNNIEDGTYYSYLDPHTAYTAGDGSIKISGMIYTYDIYDIVDIANLAVGDIIQYMNKDVAVLSVNRDNGFIDINGGMDSGTGFTIISMDDLNGWRTYTYDDYPDYYAATDIITFTVEPGTVLKDGLYGMPYDSPQVVAFDGILSYMSSDDFWDCDITLVNGKVTEIYRAWRP